MQRITTLGQLEDLQNETIIYAIVAFLIAVSISFIISNLIKFQGGDDRSYIKRRVIFIIIGLINTFGFYIYNDLIVSQRIVNTGFKSMFSTTNLKCLAITIVGYYVGGIVIMLLFRYSKFGSILGREKHS
jgi:hypothetical protein